MSSSTSAPNSHAAASGSAVPKVEPGTSVTGNKADIDNNSGGEKVDSVAEEASWITAAELKADLLPVFNDVVRIIEKDTQARRPSTFPIILYLTSISFFLFQDLSQKNKDSLEASQKVAELSKKVETLRSDIYRLPGIERSKPQQLRKLELLRKQLLMKKRLISKYKDLNLKVFGLTGSYAQ